jgi:hypothetical protein
MPLRISDSVAGWHYLATVQVLARYRRSYWQMQRMGSVVKGLGERRQSVPAFSEAKTSSSCVMVPMGMYGSLATARIPFEVPSVMLCNE